jgi:hypothetical protein
MRRAINKVFNSICRRKIKNVLPDIMGELDDYKRVSDTTGTQWITLWYAVSGIMQNKPQFILESGTGSSTLVLAATVKKLMHEDPNYKAQIISMESVREWYDVAAENLPEKYRDVAQIVYGPREEFSFGMFRGLIHSNIPQYDYDFVFLDGPDYRDHKGLSFCADVFKVMEFSKSEMINGVIDGRRSSVYVIQSMFGVSHARYFRSMFASKFQIPNVDLNKISLSNDFKNNIFGKLTFTLFRH